MQLHTTNEMSCLIHVLLKNIKELFEYFCLQAVCKQLYFLKAFSFFYTHTRSFINKTSYSHIYYYGFSAGLVTLLDT